MIKVVFAEDHQALIDGIKAFLEYEEDIKIIGEAIDGSQLLKIVEKRQPDVVVTDIRMPIMDGIEATKKIKQKFPKIQILALTMFDQAEAINQMLDAGASGYILKNSGLDVLKSAIITVAKGEKYFDNKVAVNFLNSYSEKSKIQDEKPLLSRREKEILQLIGKGKTSQQIASELFIAKTTVDTHRKNMIQKLNLTGSGELIRYAVEKKYQF